AGPCRCLHGYIFVPPPYLLICNTRQRYMHTQVAVPFGQPLFVGDMVLVLPFSDLPAHIKKVLYKIFLFPVRIWRAKPFPLPPSLGAQGRAAVSHSPKAIL
ncbi:hypothetical protein AALD01_17545, partial [Oscillospiraceae bacterium 21-37]